MKTSTFRNFISSDVNATFPAETDRYHLYVSYACPWAHRAMIVRTLKGLEDIISFTSVHWHMGESGWRFVTSEEQEPAENLTPDPLHPNFTHIRQLYFSLDPDYKGRFTVPILWDKKKDTIVNNESSEIIRMLYTEFDDFLPEKYKMVNLFPFDLQKEIEETNSWTYENINSGVYKTGFATTQENYEVNVQRLFESLNRAESHLAATGPYYFGDTITEADVRLYTTLIRFDPVYVQHFKCNIRDIRSGYPNLHKWLRNLYWKIPAFGATTKFEYIKLHYTKSHTKVNPTAITPLGPIPHILQLEEEDPSAR